MIEATLISLIIAAAAVLMNAPKPQPIPVRLLTRRELLLRRLNRP